MQINLTYDYDYDPSTRPPPANFQASVAAAAQYLDTLITNPITINISVFYGEGTPITKGGSHGNPSDYPNSQPGDASYGTIITYSELRSALSSSATSSADLVSVADLPTTDPSGGNGFYISPAQEKAWGLLPADGTEADGQLGFNDQNPYLNDPGAGLVNPALVSAAEAELTHALGRVVPWDGHETALDLFRYSGPAQLQLNPSQPSYFSIDGGNTNFNYFDTTYDYADWAVSAGNDSLDALAPRTGPIPFTNTDITEMDVLGFTIAGTPPPPTAQFAISDTTTGASFAASSAAYSGPVSGLRMQFWNPTPDDLNIAAAVPNVFIYSAGKENALSAVSGTNVLDGGSSSSFLSGGTGTDSFIIDDRNASTDFWSTIVGLHQGDSATLWGVTQQDFLPGWQDNQGAPGYTGLTLHATDAAGHTASLTLAHYDRSALDNGQLAVSFGTDPSSGSAYMLIQAVS